MSDSTERKRLSRLLIVEDEESQLRTLTDLMEDEGFEVIGCATAGEAIEQAERGEFGVAVVDLRLPDLDGTQLLKTIKALDPRIRVIMNTGYGSFDSAKKALNLGAFAYVEKAGDPDELIRHVHAAARWHLDRYATDLEEAVAARTAELRDANTELRRLIEERQRAEQERELLAEQLRQAQKMEALGQLAGGITHDFNNLLTAILANTEMLLGSLADGTPACSREALKTALEQIWAAGERASALTRQLLTFCRGGVTEPKLLDVKRVVRDVEGMLRRLIGEHVKLDVGLSPERCCIRADQGKVEQLIMNLVINAADAIPHGGRIKVEVRSADLDEAYAANHLDASPGPHVLVSVIDDGIGMTPDVMSRVFDPFFTTKPTGKGTGLGLATVYGIMRQLGGHVAVESKPGEGSVFRLHFPAVERAETQKETEVVEAQPCAGETILLCEDERLVRAVTSEALRGAGYRVIEATEGAHAMEAASAHAGPIDLLISDVVMPGMNGKELAAMLAAERPEMHVLFISGYTADLIDDHGIEASGAAFLQKPYGSGELLRRVRQILDRARAPEPCTESR